MPKTKLQLEQENAVLEAKIKQMEDVDFDRRKVLSELLGAYDVFKDRFNGGEERKVRIQSWLAIAFLIGELKGDADFSVTIEARETLKRENAELRERVYELENPKKIDG